MTQIVGPAWTEAMYKPVGGADHLGIGSVVTDRLLPALSPGINVLTPRPRYWSFYAFVIDEFWRKGQPQTLKAQRAFIRRCESMFSVAAHLCSNPNHGASAIGSRKVSPEVARRPSTYRPDFNYMKSSGGGYGLYYATVMQATGVVRLADRSIGLPVDAVTPTAGKALAEAFREAISDTEYWNKYFDSEEIPSAVLEEYAEVACLCRLREESAPDRELMVDIICHGGPQRQAASRRSALQLTLELAAQNRDVALDTEDWRWLHLYRQSYESIDGKPVRFEPPDHLREVAMGWRISQLRELFNWSLNGLWRWLHRWGMEHQGDLFPVDTAEIDIALRSASSSSIPGVRWTKTTRTGTVLQQVSNAANVTGALDNAWDFEAGLTEELLFHQSRDDTDKGAQLSSLLVLYLLCLARIARDRVQSEADASVLFGLREGGQGRIGMDFALRQLRWDIDAKRSVLDTFSRITSEYVVQQHQRVALRKLPDDTFRFRREGNSLRFFDQSSGFQMNDPRFNSLGTMCAELGWCGALTDEAHPLSKEGEKLRRHGDLPRLLEDES